MRKQVVAALAFASCLWGATAFAQDASTSAAAPAAAEATASTPADDVIHLHMPVRHRAPAPAKPADNIAPAESPSVDAIGADAASPSAAKTAAPLAVETPAPSQTEAPAKPAPSHVQKSVPTIPFTFGEDSGTAPAVSTTLQNPQPRASVSTRSTRTASLPPRPEIPKTATEPAAPVREIGRTRDEQHDGLKKRGAVLFDKGVSNPSPSQFQGVKLLAGEVSTALESGASRVQLEAYAGTPGDKSSDARRLSLRRALAVRQLLIDSGIPSNRIDVRAMGGAEDRGPDDRVDVFVRAS